MPFGTHEPHNRNRKDGWIEVITGCMFSGKTEELIRRLNHSTLAGQRVIAFKPVVDDRYHLVDVVSHNKRTVKSEPVKNVEEIYTKSDTFDVIGIDEVQFFEHDIVEVVTEMANKGKRIIATGLDMDSFGKPFGYMPQLMSIAEYVTKLQAVCMRCGDVATYSYRLSTNKDTLLVGSTAEYEARCRSCFHKGDQA